MLHGINFSDFHFLRPWWLLALPFGLWLLRRRRQGVAHNPWRRVCDPHLLGHLLVSDEATSDSYRSFGLGLMLFLAVTALAGPTWERRPQPLYRAAEGRVVVLDLSRSMDCPDLPPSRLTRARYRAIDLIKAGKGIDQGLVVFAGDAFIVAPLTDDRATLLNLLPSLDTSTPPVQGSRADRGLEKAAELFSRAKISRGQVILISDDADEKAVTAAQKLHQAGHRVDVIAVGTSEGAPIPLPDGGYLKNRSGEIVVPVPDFGKLKETAATGGGSYLLITAPESAFARLNQIPQLFPRTRGQSEALGDQWRDFGPWLLLPLLPLAALCFRRGWLTLLLLALFWGHPGNAAAFSFQDLWLRPDQQAARALKNKDYKTAAQLAQDPELKAAALYRAGKFEEAAQILQERENSRALYNRANALARSGKLEEALKAYDQALKLNPKDQDAVFNRDLVKKLLERQQQQKSNQNNKQNNKQNKSQGKDQNKNQDKKQDKKNREKSPENNQPQKSQNSSRDDSGKAENSQKSQKQEQKRQKDNGKNKGKDSRQQTSPDQQKGSTTDQRQKKEADRKQNQGQKENRSEQNRDQTEPKKLSAAQNRKSDKKNKKEQQEQEKASLGRETEKERPDVKKQALEQWLRRIPDDPGGLLRRKFMYQYREREKRSQDSKNW